MAKSESVFMCESCGRFFDSQIAALGHERSHSKDHPFVKNARRVHKKMGRSIACKVCGSKSHAWRNCPHRSI